MTWLQVEWFSYPWEIGYTEGYVFVSSCCGLQVHADINLVFEGNKNNMINSFKISYVKCFVIFFKSNVI